MINQKGFRQRTFESILYLQLELRLRIQSVGKAPKQSLIIKNSLCYILQVSIIPLVQISSDLVYRSSFSLICCKNRIAHLGLNTSRRYSCILLAWTFLSHSLQRICSLTHFSYLVFHCIGFNRRKKIPNFSDRMFLKVE